MVLYARWKFIQQLGLFCFDDTSRIHTGAKTLCIDSLQYQWCTQLCRFQIARRKFHDVIYSSTLS